MEPEGPDAASAQPCSFIMRMMGPQRLRDMLRLHDSKRVLATSKLRLEAVMTC